MGKSECGKDDCLCAFLLLDRELAQEWLQSFRPFLESAKTSLRNIKAKPLFIPWTLSSLSERETCFQQWCILQLLVGVAATLVILALSIIWYTTETLASSVGSI